MAQTISAEEGALKKGYDAVHDAKRNIDSETQKVRNLIVQMSSYWKGAAAGSFTTMMNRWDEETGKLNDVLITLEDSLRSTETDQATTEIEHQEAIKGVSAMMSGM